MKLTELKAIADNGTLGEQYNARIQYAAHAAKHFPALVEVVSEALRYIEVQAAYRGAITAAQVEAAILDNKHVSEISIGANSCNTLARFDFVKARAALAAAQEVDCE
jgi:hypothetical protein